MIGPAPAPARDGTSTPAAPPARRHADLLRAPLVGRFLRWRHARTALQSVLLALAALVVLDGLLGPQLAPRNAAGTLPWVHWRGLVVLALLVAGNLFCMACPFMLVRRVGRWLGPADRVWPRALRGKWLAVGLLVGFFWAYEAFDLWASPWLTAWVILTYFAGALVVDAFFRGAAFCKHLCPIGQFNFVHGLLSPTEVAVRDRSVCASCRTKDCIRGRWEPAGAGGRGDNLATSGTAPARSVGGLSDSAFATAAEGGAAGRELPVLPRLVQNGCELWLFQERKVGNMDCTYCMECVQACPYDNVGILARSPLPDLVEDPWRSGIGRFGQRPDLAALALVLVSAAFVNAFGMVAPVHAVQAWLGRASGLGQGPAGVALLFGLGLLVLPGLLVAGAAGVTRAVTGGREGLVEVATRWIWSLVPVGFGMWLAHYLFHFLVGGLAALPLLVERLPLPGLEPGAWTWATGALVPETWLFPLQLVLLEAGALTGLVVAHGIGRRLHAERRTALLAAAPWAALGIGLSLAGMWLLSQPMEMRGMAGG